jgi:hypothetical protein
MKRLGVAAALAFAAAVTAVVFLWPAQRSGPEPIVHGRDTCAQCRMHIGAPGFAGELRDERGELTKYDDLGCLVRAMAKAHRDFPEAWVEDRDGGGFLPLLTATLVRSPEAGTPMGSARFTREHGGEIVPLEDLLRPAPATEPVHPR